MTPDSLLYNVADTLGLPLVLEGIAFSGKAKTQFKVGPWDFEVERSAVSDELANNRCSFFVKVCGDLHLYVISSQKGVYLSLLDTSKKPGHKNIHGAVTGSMTKTMTNYTPALVATEAWNEKEKRWEEYGVAGA